MLTPVSVSHVVPVSVEYCHVPFVVTTAVTANPFTAPLSGSVILVTSADTSVPGLLPSATSFKIDVTVLAAATGASFTAAKVIVTVAVAEEVVPSDAVTVKVFAPFSFAAGT